MSSLLEACIAGDTERVRKLVAYGVDPRKVVDKNLFDATPLHYACRYVSELETIRMLWICLSLAWPESRDTRD